MYHVFYHLFSFFFVFFIPVIMLFRSKPMMEQKIKISNENRDWISAGRFRPPCPIASHPAFTKNIFLLSLPTVSAHPEFEGNFSLIFFALFRLIYSHITYNLRLGMEKVSVKILKRLGTIDIIHISHPAKS